MSRDEQVEKIAKCVEVSMCCGDCNMGNNRENCTTKEIIRMATDLVDKGFGNKDRFFAYDKDAQVCGSGRIKIEPITYENKEDKQ